jgi:hypothetical protein
MIPLLLLLLTIIYVSVSTYKLKAIPESLSATYYLWPSWVFPFFMAATGIILLPYWLEATKNSNWQFLSFIACMSCIFVGCAPNYKKDDLKIHMIAAYITSFAALLSISLVLNWEILVGVALTTFLFNFREIKTKYVFLLEMTILYSLYISLI